MSCVNLCKKWSNYYWSIWEPHVISMFFVQFTPFLCTITKIVSEKEHEYCILPPITGRLLRVVKTCLKFFHVTLKTVSEQQHSRQWGLFNKVGIFAIVSDKSTPHSWSKWSKSLHGAIHALFSSIMGMVLVVRQHPKRRFNSYLIT